MPSASCADPTPLELLAVRKAAGEEYANTLLRPSTASRFHVAGQCRHTDQCGDSMHAKGHSWLHGNRVRTCTNTVEDSSPDSAKQRPEDPDSPCVMQQTALPLQAKASSHGLMTPSEYGGSLQSRPRSSGAHHWRRCGHGNPASATPSTSFGHMSLSVQSPSAIADPLFQRHRVQQDCPSSSSYGLSAPAAGPPARQRPPRHQHAKECHPQHQSTPTAEGVQDLSTPPHQRTRSVTSQLINPTEIEMSIRKLCGDRSPDLMKSISNQAHAMSASSISACGMQTGRHPSSSVREKLEEADLPSELSLRGGISDEKVGLGSSAGNLCEGAAGCEEVLPPFPVPICSMGLPDQSDHVSTAGFVTHHRVQEKSSGEAVRCHGDTRQQLYTHGGQDGNHVKRNDASAESCSNYVTKLPQQLSVVDAYLRLGVSCPGEEAPALQPWNTSAWKSAWEGSGMRGMGRAGLWTLEAINCIVWDRCASVYDVNLESWKEPCSA